MGTLTDQPGRQSKRISPTDVKYFVADLVKISIDHKISLSDAIRIFEILEQRRKNDLFVADRDIFDEQMRGIGLLWEHTNELIDSLTGVIEKQKS